MILKTATCVVCGQKMYYNSEVHKETPEICTLCENTGMGKRVQNKNKKKKETK